MVLKMHISSSDAKYSHKRGHLPLAIAVTLVMMCRSFVSSAPANPVVTTYARGNSGQSNLPKDPLMYVRVMKKMDTFCESPYKESDDRRIEMYSKCFSQLIKADPEVVRSCRSKVFGNSNRQLKAADCERSGGVNSFAHKSQEIRSCITSSMRRKNSNYSFSEEDDEVTLRTFLSCMDSVFP